MASKFVKETKEFPSKKHDYFKQIQQAKAEFYINSVNTSWDTIENKYNKMIKTASSYKKPLLERAYQLLKEYYEGYDSIDKSAREAQIGHPTQIKEHKAKREEQMAFFKDIGGRAKKHLIKKEVLRKKSLHQARQAVAKGQLHDLAKQAKQKRLKDWKIYNPAGNKMTIEYKIPYEARLQHNYKIKNRVAKEELMKERLANKLKYVISRSKADALARAKSNVLNRQQRWDKYTNPKNPKRKTGKKRDWRKPRTRTKQSIRDKYDTQNKKNKPVKYYK